jgi:phosphatidate cytidylyltransferase
VVRTRIATAAALIPVVVAGVVLLDTIWFAALAGVVVLQGAWEWTGLAGCRDVATRIGFLGLLVAVAAAMLTSSADRLARLIAMGATIWWLVGALWLHAYQSGRAGAGPFALRVVVGLLVLLPVWTSLVALHGREPGGRSWVLFLLAMIWIADTAAYLVGRRYGRRPLASAVSPGKSWEGVAAGLGGGLAAGAGFALYRDMQGVEMLVFLMVCAGTVAASIVGDLMESMMKRSANLKDSGNLLPGHGGLLDRIDSLTAAAPVFLAGLIAMGRLV